MSTEPLPSSAPTAMSRRTAVKLVAAGLVGTGIGGGASALFTFAGASPASPYRFFSLTEAALVIELCEQIIPRDEVAGATDAGVIHYIDRQLAGVFAEDQPLYRQGLAALERTCTRLHGRPFAALSPEQKIVVMQLVEKRRVPGDLWAGIDASDFFSRLVDHTMQGFYGSPRHGGNRDYVGYRILGLDYPQVIGRNLLPSV